MSKDNLCVTFTAPREVALQSAPVPEPAAGEVLIRTRSTGISAGTELNVYRGVAPQWRTRQDPETGLFVDGEGDWSYPMRYGYANVGLVEATGPGVSGLAPGDQVFTYKPHCEWVLAAAEEVVVLPELPDLRRGVFLANLNTALNGVLDARPALGDAIVVSGLGVIGLIVVQLLARSGTGTVIGVDPVEQRRTLAAEAGAAVTCAPGEPVAELVRELTGGRGADVVVEVSGSSAALASAIRIAGYGARVIAMSWYGTRLDGLGLAAEFHHNRIQIVSSQAGAVNPDLGPLWSVERRMSVATGLLSELELERYITHEFQPAEAPQAYQLLDELTEPALQCVFDFEGER